ncbi:MAG: DUF4143 domain-containing protein [Oligoflexia bacterium]|nr:DUF4143 domain-containing protein [Oligoflexia bacterium]
MALNRASLDPPLKEAGLRSALGSKVPDNNAVQNLYRLIIESSGSTISVNNLAQTLHKSHDSTSNMLSALEKVWMIWKLESYHKQLTKIIRKDCKYYPVDWIFDDKLEVKTAVLLQRRIMYLRQSLGENLQLYFYRDYEQREVDFVITLDDSVVLAIECKEKENSLPSTLKYFCKTFNCPGVVITNQRNQLDLIGKNFIITSIDIFSYSFL